MITVGRQGNQAIAITDPTVSRSHCTITPLGSDSYVVENISENNFTLVNGQKIMKCTVKGDAVIQLGPNFSCKVSDLLKKDTPVGSAKAEVSEFSIKRLRLVHEEYEKTCEEITAKQKSIQDLRALGSTILIGTGAISATLIYFGIGDYFSWISTFFPLIGAGMMVSSYLKGKNDDSKNVKKKALEQYQENYVCPNPSCHHTLSQAPRLLLLNKTCPYCHCKYTE